MTQFSFCELRIVSSMHKRDEVHMAKIVQDMPGSRLSKAGFRLGEQDENVPAETFFFKWNRRQFAALSFLRLRKASNFVGLFRLHGRGKT